VKERYAEAAINIWTMGGGPSGMDAIVLNLPGRDQKIEEYNQYLRTLAKAGVHNAGAWGGSGIWSSGRGTTRGAPAREFDLASPDKHAPGPGGAVFKEPLSYGREFTREEIWDNFSYFMKRVAPVAEEVGVRIAIHPADPPVPKLGGVPRLFCNFDDYRRAMEIANSPNVGILLCCGCWLEGGRQLTGKDPEEMIRYFGPQKIWAVHFRNVSAPLPHFVETFLDNGYYDMYKIMKALRDVNFNGIVDPDHTPSMVGGRSVQMAYSFAYMRALLNRANAEAKA
jgi:mannonate dehydratase